MALQKVVSSESLRKILLLHSGRRFFFLDVPFYLFLMPTAKISACIASRVVGSFPHRGPLALRFSKCLDMIPIPMKFLGDGYPRPAKNIELAVD